MLKYQLFIICLMLFYAPAICQNNIIYGELTSEPDNSFFITQTGTLYFRYNEKYSQTATAKLNYKIYNYQRTALNTTSLPLTKKYGMNYFSLALTGVTGLTSGSYYFLEVVDDKGGLTKLRFKYTP